MIMTYFRPALMLTACFVALTGLAFPGLVWSIANVAFPDQASGSLVRDAQGTVVGSALIGQSFTRPEYFHSRPSAAGAGYDASNSGGTNLGPTSRKLVEGIKDDPTTPDVDERYSGYGDLAVAYRELNGLTPDAVIPADAATRSGSGLDPHISPRNALLQAGRVARARGTTREVVLELVERHTERPFAGMFGEPRVNVLLLNLALDEHR